MVSGNLISNGKPDSSRTSAALLPESESQSPCLHQQALAWPVGPFLFWLDTFKPNRSESGRAKYMFKMHCEIFQAALQNGTIEHLLHH